MPREPAERHAEGRSRACRYVRYIQQILQMLLSESASSCNKFDGGFFCCEGCGHALVVMKKFSSLVCVTMPQHMGPIKRLPADLQNQSIVLRSHDTISISFSGSVLCRVL
jgi:hypothetical protein